MTTDEKRTIRNALMECWTPIELAYVLERTSYARAIATDTMLRKCLVSTINRITTLKEIKDNEFRRIETTAGN